MIDRRDAIVGFFAIAPHVFGREDAPKAARSASPAADLAILLGEARPSAQVHGRGLAPGAIAEGAFQDGDWQYDISRLQGRCMTCDHEAFCRFRVGDHLEVRRGLLYFHHGVYLGNDEVAQFGGRISDKRSARFGLTTLAEFEREGVARVVQHGRADWTGLPLPLASERQVIVERTLWVLANYRPGAYNLLGNNCECLANFCVTGATSETNQIRIWIGLFRNYGTLAGLVLIDRRARRGQLSRRDASRARLVLFVVSFVPSTIWAFHRYRFLREIRTRWNEHVAATGMAPWRVDEDLRRTVRYGWVIPDVDDARNGVVE